MNSFPYPSMRDRFDLRFYFVVGPDDCGNRPILDVVAKALDGGASFIQLRAKTQDVAEIGVSTGSSAGSGVRMPLAGILVGRVAIVVVLSDSAV